MDSTHRDVSQFERYSCLKLVTPLSGLNPMGLWHDIHNWFWSLNSQ